MADQALQPKRMTIDEFFEWQSHQEANYELVDGIPVLPIKSMTGATRRHDRVTVNAILSLGTQLRGSPCRVSTSDQSVITGDATTRRPDLSIDCGSAPDKSMAAATPTVVVEILSPSTMRFDRFRKVAEYQNTMSVQVILLVDTETPRVTIHRRGPGGWQLEEAAGLTAAIDLPEVGARLPLADLYDGLTFDADA